MIPEGSCLNYPGYSRQWQWRSLTDRWPPCYLQVKWVIQMATPDKQEFNGEWTSFKRQLKGKDGELQRTT